MAQKQKDGMKPSEASPGTFDSGTHTVTANEPEPLDFTEAVLDSPAPGVQNNEPKPLDSTAAVLDSPAPGVQNKEVRDLFRRAINQNAPIRSLTLKRVLTRPLVSMSRTKQLAVIAQSEMYTMPLPLTGRGGGTGEVRVFDAQDASTGEDVIVICHQIMVSALQRAGYRTLEFKQSEEDGDTFPEKSGRSLSGAKFAFLSGDVVEGKRYRSVSVAELE